MCVTDLVFSDRWYTDQHEWITVDGKIGTVGASNYAQVQHVTQTLCFNIHNNHLHFHSHFQMNLGHPFPLIPPPLASSAGLVESNGSLPPGLRLKSPAG